MQGNRVATFLLLVTLLIIGAGLYMVSVDEVVLRSRTLDYGEAQLPAGLKILLVGP